MFLYKEKILSVFAFIWIVLFSSSYLPPNVDQQTFDGMIFNSYQSESPPMGWNSWNWFGKKEVNEQIVREIIDAFVNEGLKEAGYEYIVIDGGWRDNKLGLNHELLPHPVKFPNGIKPLADYAHSKGLKLGLHTVPGSRDCGGDRVGAYGFEEVHIQQFIDWGIDFVKLDKCLIDGGWNEELVREVYFKWHRLLKETRRDIVFSISAYEYREWYPEIADMARTTYDISCKKYRGANFDDTKQGFMSLADQNNEYADFAGNGYWNDPDILVIGEQGLNEEEQKVHFALWCLMSAPLMLGNDPRNMLPLEMELALNKDCININQDPTEQGKRLIKNGDKEIWIKHLQDGSIAVLLLNRSKTKNQNITLSLEDIGIFGKVNIKNIYTGKKWDNINDSFTRETGPHEGWFLKIVNNAD
ncbi:glycoside hydrolase family 27 protein [Bacteroidota bacterium]